MLFLVSAHGIPSPPFYDCISALLCSHSAAMPIPVEHVRLCSECRTRRRPMPFLDSSSSSSVVCHARVIQSVAAVSDKLIKTEQRIQRTSNRIGRARVSIVFSLTLAVYLLMMRSSEDRKQEEERRNVVRAFAKIDLKCKRYKCVGVYSRKSIAVIRFVLRRRRRRKNTHIECASRDNERVNEENKQRGTIILSWAKEREDRQTRHGYI